VAAGRGVEAPRVKGRRWQTQRLAASTTKGERHSASRVPASPGAGPDSPGGRTVRSAGSRRDADGSSAPMVPAPFGPPVSTNETEGDRWSCETPATNRKQKCRNRPLNREPHKSMGAREEYACSQAAYGIPENKRCALSVVPNSDPWRIIGVQSIRALNTSRSSAMPARSTTMTGEARQRYRLAAIPHAKKNIGTTSNPKRAL
jgi:hypothetical protein